MGFSPESNTERVMRKIAERANVQPASLVRLSQQLGFPGWNELRGPLPAGPPAPFTIKK